MKQDTLNIHRLNLLFIIWLGCFAHHINAQEPAALKKLMSHSEMKHATVSCLVKEVGSTQYKVNYQANQRMTPASVMKLITTATALELLGEDYRYPTDIQYDGNIVKGVLKGNLYIKGHGDPTLGSTRFGQEATAFLKAWIQSIQKAGIRKIEGRIIADESILDNEGISMKWVYEDLGSYYGMGSYGVNVFENTYSLYLNCGEAGRQPRIVRTDPQVPITFHNYLKAQTGKDSCLIVGMPFVQERYLFGVVPAGQANYKVKGDIPDPALYLAQYLQKELAKLGIETDGKASCYRILQEKGEWKNNERKTLTTTYSPTLSEIVSQTNHVSQNLFADALLKTIGLRYEGNRQEAVSSFERGVRVLNSFWKKRGIDLADCIMYDGSGLSLADKISAQTLQKILVYMNSQSKHADVYKHSIPTVGQAGSVRNFLKGTTLEGKGWLKSGSMSRVRCYAGYFQHNGKLYSTVVLINNFDGKSTTINRYLSQFFLSLFGE